MRFGEQTRMGANRNWLFIQNINHPCKCLLNFFAFNSCLLRNIQRKFYVGEREREIRLMEIRARCC